MKVKVRPETLFRKTNAGGESAIKKDVPIPRDGSNDETDWRFCLHVASGICVESLTAKYGRFDPAMIDSKGRFLR